MSDSYCEWGECERETREGRTLCEMHEKRKQRGQPMSAEPQEKLTPIERFIVAAVRLAETDSDNDAEYDANRGAVVRAGKVAFGDSRAVSEAIRAGMERARQQGKRLGAPPRLDPEMVRAAVAEVGIKRAARMLSASRNAVRRALRRGAQGSKPDPSAAPGEGSTIHHCEPSNIGRTG